jgi:hypothetical protein
MWGKLQNDEFTTFRFARRDKDYQVEEKLQAWYRQRSPKRQYLFNVEVVSKYPKWLIDANGLYINVEEAKEDGFETPELMFTFLHKAHGKRVYREPINKLTLRKI